MVIDDFSTGSRDNLIHLADNPGLTIIEDDVTHCPALGQLVADSDYVFHLAAAVGVDLVVQSPIRTIETNLKSTEAILEAAAAASRMASVDFRLVSMVRIGDCTTRSTPTAAAR